MLFVSHSVLGSVAFRKEMGIAVVVLRRGVVPRDGRTGNVSALVDLSGDKIECSEATTQPRWKQDDILPLAES